MNENDIRSVRRVVVRGRVQGVGYRAWTEYAARKRGLAGWVRNRPDGSVEAVFSGPAHAVGGMVEACRSGPPGAWVDDLDQYDTDPNDLAKRNPDEDFSILETGG
jgi:acylphosphatase